MALPAEFPPDRRSDFRIGLVERGLKKESTAEAVLAGELGLEDGGFIGGISPPPQPFGRDADGHMWGAKAVRANYHIGPPRPSTCGTGLDFMQDMVDQAVFQVPGSRPPFG